jgi:hypothetical protein
MPQHSLTDSCSLALVDDKWKHATREVDQRVGQRIKWTMWPAPMTTAVFSFARTLISQNVSQAWHYFGFPTSEPPSPLKGSSERVQSIQSAVRSVQQHSTKDPGSVKDPRAMAQQQATGGSNQAAPRDAQKAKDKEPPQESKGGQQGQAEGPGHGGAKTGETEDDHSKFYTDLQKTMSLHLEPSTKSFWKTLSAKWRPPRDLPVSGSILVSGLVELEGPAAFMTIDVAAWWDPQTRRFEPRTTHMSIRRFQYKKQAPQRQ